jgi:Mg2+ and Co2+ transporter CorA
MEEVEIKNVGGPRPRDGVASEATLAELLETIKNNGRSTGTSSSRAETRAVESFTRATRESTQNQGALAKTVAATEAAMDLFQTALNKNTMRLSEFTESLIGNGNLIFRTLNRFNYFIDENIDRWRGLSQVGASFGNSLNELVSTAVDGRMTLNEFSQMVLSNSEVLRSLSGTVTEGSKRFASLSRQLRASDIGRNLYDIGFSFEDINETLLNYIDISRRSMNNQRLSDRQLMEGTAAYVDELERLTKLTGMSRREAQQAMAQQLQDQRIRMRLAQMAPEEAARFQSNMAYLDNQVSGMGEVFRQLASMDPGDELSRLLQVFAPDLAAGARNIQNMTTGELHNFIASFGDQIDSIAAGMGEQQVAVLYRTNSVFREMFNMASQANRLSVLSADERQRLDRELESRSELTSLFANFEEQLRQIVGNIVGTFFEVAGETGGLNDVLGNLASAFRRLISPHTDGSVTSLTGTFSELVRTVFGPRGSVVSGIRTFTAFLERPETRERFDNFIEGIKNFSRGLVDFLFGVQQEGAENTERVGGLFRRLYDMFISVVDSDRSFTQMLFDGFRGIFRSVGEEIVSYFEMSQVAGEGPWTAIYNHVSTGLIDWLEGNQTTTNNTDLWNRLTTSVGNRLLDLFDIERATLDNGNTEPFWNAIFRSLNEKLFGYMEEIETPAGTVEVRRSGLIDTVIESINNMFADQGLVDSMVTALTGLFNTVGTAFTNFWNGPTGQQIKNDVTDFFRELIYTMEDLLVNSWWARMLLGISREEVARRNLERSSGRPTSERAAENFGEILSEGLSQYSGTMTGAQQTEMARVLPEILSSLSDEQRAIFQEIHQQASIIPNNTATINALTRLASSGESTQEQRDLIRAIYAQLAERGIIQTELQAAESERQALIERLERSIAGENEFWGNEARGRANVMEELVDLNRRIISLGGAAIPLDELPGFNQGTIGFENFGKESLVKLHGYEAVVPRDTLQGDLLSQFYAYQTSQQTPLFSTEFIQRSLNSLEKNLSSVMTNSTNNIMGVIKNIFLGVADNFNKQLATNLQSTENNLKDFVKDTNNFTVTHFNEKLMSIEEKFSSFVNYMAENFLTISKDISNLYTDINSKFEALGEKIVNLISTVLDFFVKQETPDVQKKANDLVKDVADQISSTASKLLDFEQNKSSIVDNIKVDMKGYSVNPTIGGFSNVDKTINSLNKKPDTDVSKDTMNDLIEKIIELNIEKPDNPSAMMPVKEDTTQTDLTKKIDELNKTMLQVVALMSEELQVQKKTLRGVHGMGGDLMKGIAR